MKIVVLDGFTANPGDLSWDAFRELGDLTVYDRTPASETVARAVDADAVLTNKVVFDAETLDALPNLRYIGVLATGFNVVDLQKAREQGVVVTNVPTYSAESVVQATFAHLLNLASSLAVNAAAVRDGAWSTAPDFTFSRGPLTELFGKRFGIVGFGTIGRRVAEVARAFGMEVVAFGPRLTVGSERTFRDERRDFVALPADRSDEKLGRRGAFKSRQNRRLADQHRARPVARRSGGRGGACLWKTRRRRRRRSLDRASRPG